MPYVEFLEFSVPHIAGLMVILWCKKQFVRKEWVTQEHCDHILSQVRVVLIVVACLAFCVYYMLIPHPPW